MIMANTITKLPHANENATVTSISIYNVQDRYCRYYRKIAKQDGLDTLRFRLISANDEGIHIRMWGEVTEVSKFFRLYLIED